MRYTTLILTALLLCSSAALGDSYNGFVTDKSGNPLPGASVISDVTGVGTLTDNNGRFKLDAESITRLTFSSVGYQPRQFSVGNLPDTVRLESYLYETGGITVTADRARPGQTPIAYENVSSDKIERDYGIGDMPLLLNSTPNYYSFSDAAGHLGYTYTQIRGFDDKRIASYLNGVPMNDPEDQYTYWVDLPDFLSNVTDVQIQRGVGNSLYGDASFGGAVNVVTNTFALPRQTVIESGYGEFYADGKSVGKSYKQSVEYSSGLIDGRWAFSGRFSKQKSDGYRENAWVDAWAYYFSLARLDPKSTTELQVFGGPMSLHLTFLGVPRSVLETNRRFNPLSYRYETDNFSQPHFHLHNRYELSDRAILSNTIYYIRGKGYFEQQRSGVLFSDFNIDTSVTGGALTGDLVQQQSVAKYQLGWNPRLDIQHDNGSHSLGGSFYYFESDHDGKVVSAQPIVAPIDSRHEYYRYFGEKVVASIFAQEQYRFSSKLSVQATAQLRYQKYTFTQNKIGAFAGYEYDADWLFLSPRLGFNYNLIDEPSHGRMNIYANFAVASRTPTDAALYDASDTHAFPSLEVSDIRLSSSGDSLYTFGDPTAGSERVYDVEAGLQYQANLFSFGANLYWMDFTDEIIPYGGINPSTGQTITVNADGSYRMGIELSGSYQASSQLKFDGNISLNRYRIKDFLGSVPIFDNAFNYVGDTTVEFNDRTGLAFPKYLGTIVADYQQSDWRVTSRTRFIGKQYMELLNLNELAIDAYTVSSLSVSYRLTKLNTLGHLIFSVTVDNMFDTKFETSGYGWNYRMDTDATLLGDAEYYVGPERSFFALLRLELI